MWFLWNTLRISWTAKKSNKMMFTRSDTIRSLIEWKRKTKINYVITGMIKGKCSRGKQ